ncbi:MAG TPA: isoprenylcysteine carboxylmethyltransferase family protein, partial [Polyangiaceae bacterium]|nr:isoprenylcysteine carboxylmethyltransferase family protein [Polyangiaceae bacterium]
WGTLHSRIRKNRLYAQGRKATSTDAPYRWLNPVLFVMQLTLCTASFWTESPWLLAAHPSNAVRWVGVVLFCGGSGLYAWALAHLGANYSPCYDSCAPIRLVRSGPYSRIRHPMYAGKIIVAIGTVVVSGSLWFVPTTIYLLAATLRAMRREDCCRLSQTA